MRSRLFRNVVWVLAILVAGSGLYVSYRLTLKHLRPASRSASFLDEACVDGAVNNCDKAVKSPYGYVYYDTAQGIHFGKPGEKKAGMPTAELGSLFFVGVLTWLLLIGQVSPSRWWAHLIFVLGTLASVGISVFFEVIMWTQLEASCPLCVVTHIASLLLFIFALLLWPRWPKSTAAPVVVPPESTGVPDAAPVPTGASDSLFAPAPPAAPQRAAVRPRPTVFMVCLTPIVAYLAFMVVQLQPRLVGAKDREKYYREKKEQLEFRYSHWRHAALDYNLSPQLWIDTTGRPSRGPENARHVIIVFSDFQCPACGRFEEKIIPWVKEKAKRMGGARFVFFNWPICIDCNPTAKNNLHPLACEAAKATEAAHIVGGNDAFWKMHDMLFERQKEWTKLNPLPFADYAEEIGLDPDAFTKTMNSEEVATRIEEQVAYGISLGQGYVSEKQQSWLKVHSTPTVYVNNKRLSRMSKTGTWLNALTSKTKPLTSRPAPPAGTQPEAGARQDGSGSDKHTH